MNAEYRVSRAMLHARMQARLARVFPACDGGSENHLAQSSEMFDLLFLLRRRDLGDVMLLVFCT